jgi:RimJ/RimL family protein N-acetyltransferase
MEGRFCQVEKLNTEAHAPGLHKANRSDVQNRMWTYLAYGPFETFEDYEAWVRTQCASTDPLFFAIVDRRGNIPVGVASLLAIRPESGCIEVGHVAYSPLLQRSPVATEAMFLLMKRVFELGYRRCEWKCDALNAPSRAAAQRLGFTFEGIFRQATLYKQRNRDTVWFSIIDREWPMLSCAFTRWLDPANFDSHGQQRARLSELTAAIHLRRPNE